MILCFLRQSWTQDCKQFANLSTIGFLWNVLQLIFRKFWHKYQNGCVLAIDRLIIKFKDFMVNWLSNSFE